MDGAYISNPYLDKSTGHRAPRRTDAQIGRDDPASGAQASDSHRIENRKRVQASERCDRKTYVAQWAKPVSSSPIKAT
ncbi:hypothetical protein GCM10007857_70750 [Bradyrhizobium iriomotense]|uniref:Transposase DDE domain-containing protein n=1 Tax=Bradyrhizobium iriomotense TaxID=441950 RepID=A0ABQ6B9I9_9BRAD|nr:hypothetical protein GCM10007857_70750 [Bradyrhizobium iriomotense]